MATRAQIFSFCLAGALLAANPAASEPERWRAQGWTQTDFSKATAEWHEILPGGPPKDGIPAIDAPRFVAAAKLKRSDIGKNEPVITVALDGERGEVRAYPLRLLVWHEIVNDTVGGVPIAVTYCPLCNSSLVFRRTHEGEVLDFGTTGLLRRANLLMYDRASESWWQQFTGEAIVGKYAGARLEHLPSRIESFARLKKRHPKAQVLIPNNPRARNYGATPYAFYENKPYPFLFKGKLPDKIAPMARVVAFAQDGKPRAVALSFLADAKRVTLGAIELRWAAGQNSVLEAREIARARDIGNVQVRERTGGGWEDIPYDVTFAFAFFAFHPDAPIYLAQEELPR